MKLKMKLLLMLTVVLMAFGSSGCQTMEGFGKDMQQLGDSIEDKANGDDDDETE